MITTQCPLGQDPRMCAHCVHNATCASRCDTTKCDVIWGEITGDLTDQTDLAAEFAAVRSEITHAASFSNVRLNIIDDNLYVIAPVGELNADTDQPVFARYTRSSIRQIVDGRNFHYKRRGWIRPTQQEKLNKKYPYVPMVMEKVTRWDSDVYDYFVVKSGASDFMNQSRTYTSKVARDLYVAYPPKNDSLRLKNKKLGLCIERNGVQITDYLPFAVRHTQHIENDVWTDGYVLSRWNTYGVI